jgi:hypothetical protein
LINVPEPKLFELWTIHFMGIFQKRVKVSKECGVVIVFILLTHKQHTSFAAR